MKTSNFLIIFLIMLSSAYAIDTSRLSPAYENVFLTIDIFEIVKTSVSYSCYDGISKNITCHKDITLPIFIKKENIITGNKAIGYTDGKDTIRKNINKDKDVLSIWKYDVGERNMNEFGRCRQFEIDKGVCYEIK